jgi:2-dehydropantoate 2-reductase
VKIVIVGAGGLGSYIGAVLDRAGHDVTLVARGPHRIAIESHGLQVRSHAGDFVAHPRCVASGLELDGADLTFVVTKTYSLDEVAPQLVHLAAQGSAVVSLLNGVTAVERLVEHGLARSRLADGVAYMTSFRVEPGVVERKAAHQRIVVPGADPPADPPADSPADSPTDSPTDSQAESTNDSGGDREPAELVREAFADTLVDVEVARDIRVELWEKMSVVCSLSVLCAIGERHMGSLRAHPFGGQLQREAIEEVLSVGRAHGVAIPADAEHRIDATLDRFPDEFFPSVIHDLNSGRRTEMADLGGEIVRMGVQAGVPTPLHAAGTLIVQLAEA